MKQLVYVSLVFLLFASCKKESSSTLSPARNIEGTWKTSLNVTYYIKTDFCTSDLEDVATQQRMVTWKITHVTDTSVNITQTFTSSNFTVTNTACSSGAGYTPDVSPTFYTGTISSTTLTIKDSNGDVKGVFTFTTDLMEGNWDDSWCIAFCQEVYTKNKEFKLVRQ